MNSFELLNKVQIDEYNFQSIGLTKLALSLQTTYFLLFYKVLMVYDLAYFEVFNCFKNIYTCHWLPLDEPF